MRSAIISRIAASIASVALPLGLSLGLSACLTNSGMDKLTATNRSPSSSTTTNAANYYISTVTIGTSSTSSSSESAKIFFDASKSPGPISDNCNIATSSSTQTAKPCACLFAWTEVNQTTGVAVNVPRRVQTAILNVQSTVIECNLPSVYATEISEGTKINISVVASQNNSSSFNVPPYLYVKKSAVASSFQDAEGHSFENILRYSCFDLFKRGLAIQSRRFTATNSTTSETRDVLLASQFCLAKGAGGGDNGTSPECAGLRGIDYSSQSYYYNLYIRASERGSINVENANFKCPLVKESLRSSGSVGSSLDYWPLDTSFALAASASSDYPIGVEGFSKVGIPGDASTQGSSCFPSATPSSTPSGTPTTTSSGTSTSSGSSDGLVKSCMGFAAKPSSDGTCPFIKDASGALRPTYRLRRFITLYPPRFDTDGKMIDSQPQPTDTIYVLDRPVTGPDPMKPYTMRGPKPCPFSYFDQSGVLGDPNDNTYGGRMPSYAATSNAAWNGLNVDGIEFPHDDTAGQSCSAAIPLLSDDKTTFSVGTLNKTNPVLKRMFVRPVKAWAPHYEEDTNFQACAPLADPLQDPPLHFSKDSSSGNVAWCAEAYPSQNPYVNELDKYNGTYPGRVIPYTSHVSKNSLSPACTSTSISSNIPSGYPADPSTGTCGPLAGILSGVAYHPDNLPVDSYVPSSLAPPGTCTDAGTPNGGTCYYCARKTCDRTVQNPNFTWSKFPLLARPAQVEDAIAADSTYGCIITYDNGNGKTGAQSPLQGCCGNSVKVWTGKAGSIENDNKSAHLEPGTTCATPAY